MHQVAPFENYFFFGGGGMPLNPNSKAHGAFTKLKKKILAPTSQIRAIRYALRLILKDVGIISHPFSCIFA